MAEKYPNITETNYFTNRALENDNGEKTGKIIMWRVKGSEKFHYTLKCPYCGDVTERDELFEKRPYRPWCNKCGKTIMIEKIKAKKNEKINQRRA